MKIIQEVKLELNELDTIEKAIDILREYCDAYNDCEYCPLASYCHSPITSTRPYIFLNEIYSTLAQDS